MKRRRRTGWDATLDHPLPVRGGRTITTLRDARAYIMDDLPEGHHDYNCWQMAGRLILHAAETGADIVAATYAMESALFLDYRLDLKRLYSK